MIDIDALKESVNKIFDMEEEENDKINNLMNVKLKITNLNIREFVTKFPNNNVNVTDINLTPPVYGTDVIFHFNDENHSYVKLIDSGTMIPYVENAEDVFIHHITNIDNKMMDSGFCVIYSIEDTGLFCYVPYDRNKKTYGIFKICRDLNDKGDRLPKRLKFYYSNTVKHDSEIISVAEPENPLRHCSSAITTRDILMASNLSAKFKKLSEKWGTLSDALNDLETLLLNTVDPMYMAKIMEINKYLCHDRSYDQ